MKYTIKATNYTLTPEVKEALEEKIATLDKFVPRVKPISAAIEIASMVHRKKGEVYYVEVNIKVPGKVLRSQTTQKNIYKAINKVKDKLQVLLKKYNKSG